MNFNQLDRPLSSRFQEHFDYQLAPPAELLSDSSSKGIESNLEKKKKRKKKKKGVGGGGVPETLNLGGSPHLLVQPGSK